MIAKKQQNLCVITALYPLYDGFSGIFVKDQCKMLQNQGYHVTVLYAAGGCPRNLPAKDYFSKVEYVENDGIGVYVNHSHYYASTYTIPFLKVAICNSAERMLTRYMQERGKPAVLISHFSYPAGVGAVYLAKKYNIPLLAIEHSSLLLQENKYRRLNGFFRNVVETSSACICVSDALKEALVRRIGLKDKISVIPNVLDGRFQYRLRNEAKNFTFVSVGNLVDVKNFPLLIQAFTLAFRNQSDVTLRIAGGGPLQTALQEQIDSLGMSDRITLLGKQPREQLLQEYENCDCFILLSKRETFGIVYREAMAVGRPVISSDNGGIYNAWEDKFGLIVKEKTAEAAAEAMIDMYHNISQYDGQYIAQRMKELYSEQSVGKRQTEIIERIINSEKVVG